MITNYGFYEFYSTLQLLQRNITMLKDYALKLSLKQIFEITVKVGICPKFEMITLKHKLSLLPVQHTRTETNLVLLNDYVLRSTYDKYISSYLNLIEFSHCQHHRAPPDRRLRIQHLRPGH